MHISISLLTLTLKYNTMSHFRLRVVSFCIIHLLLLLRSEGSRHKHKHSHSEHHHKSSHISEPPSPSPSPSPSPAPDLAPELDPINNVFDVRRFGALGDGTADDTDAFKAAWDAACIHGDILLVPNGYSFMIHSTVFTGPCKPGLVFQLDGTIVAPDGPEAWPQGNSRRQWLVFYRVNGMALEGGGLIDGRGHKWWELPCKPHKGNHIHGPCDSPIAMRFFMSSNLRVRGVRVKDSPQFHFRFDGCENVHIESISITAPALSPNTDGIHIENTNSVEIYNSVIANGDDCVSIGSGCHGVDIRNITCGPGHGISIGSLGKHNSRACVRNVTVRESTIRASSNGVRIKTWQGGTGSVSEVLFSGIRMEGVRNPIIIDQFYCPNKGSCPNQTSAVSVSHISYDNIKGTYDIRSPAMHLGCSDAVPCTNLTLSDVELLPALGDTLSDPFCSNAYYGGDIQTLLTIPPLISCLLQGLPPGSTLQTNDNSFC